MYRPINVAAGLPEQHHAGVLKVANSIFPDEVASGGVIYRDEDGFPTNPPNVENIYSPPPSYEMTCAATALPNDCTARVDPKQINAIVSELVAFAECLDPDGPWDCNSLQNLCAAFNAYKATLGEAAYSKAEADARFVNIAGDTMTGHLKVPMPADADDAVPREYVDGLIFGGGATGGLVYITDNVAPMGVPDNSLWWNAGDGILYVLYNDGSSTQWVVACPVPDALSYLMTAGGTMTGPLILSGAPSVPNEAATKAYVDSLVGVGTVRYDTAQSLAGASQFQARQNIGASYGTANCRLVYVSATSIRLDPFGGDSIKIAGVVYQIPQAGVSISNAGLAANTLYYVYAYMNAGVMTLELSTTGWIWSILSTNIGVACKNGDNTRSLVGMIRTINTTPGQFADSATLRFVASFYNRRPRGMQKATATTNTNSVSILELGGGNERLNFLMWSDTAAHLFYMVPTDLPDNGSAASTGYSWVGVDGVAQTGACGTTYVYNGSLGNSFQAVSNSFDYEGSEGFHYFHVLWGVSTAGHTMYCVSAATLAGFVFI